MEVADTKQSLLDAAEKLFAERGFAATPMREISSAAGANLAAAHYHFGGKRGLMEAVLTRRIAPINTDRLRRLDDLEAKAGRRSPALEDVLGAFVAPAIELTRDLPGGSPHFARLMGRTFIEPDPDLHAFFMGLFQEVADRFIPAFQRALPKLPEPDLFWRLHMMIGCLAHTLGDPDRLKAISKGAADPTDANTAIRQLVTFVAGGLRAPRASSRRKNAS